MTTTTTPDRTTAPDRTGYWNRVLHVDLHDRSWHVEEPGDAFFRTYGGGRGLIAHYLLRFTPAGADPLGPENTLVFAPGVLTGAPVPGAGRHSVGAKSPLTGGWGEAEAGGFWGAELKRAGWDAIVVRGAADTPVTLSIRDGEVEIRDAAHLWGRLAHEVEDALRAELDDKFVRIAQCGIAGENLVRFAMVGNDLNEAAGRTGLGAVMGAKKLKAVAVRGTQAVPLADKAAVKEIAKWVSGTLDDNHRAFHEYGTGAAMQGKNLEGGMPTSNYRYGEAEGIERIDAVAIREQVSAGMEACYACSVRCKKVVRIEQRQADAGVDKKGNPIAFDPEGRWAVNPRYGGPEYESLAALGPSVQVDDIIAVCKSNELCNAFGMDTISAGATIAWAMEAYERGIITDEHTGGMPLRFGDAAVVVQLLEQIARREGLGDLLAEGSQRAAARLGGEEFLTTVKNMEMAMHDPRHMPVMRHSYLLSPTGGDHLRHTDFRAGVRNQVGLCVFLQYDDAQTLQIMNGVTGWGIDQSEMEVIAERGITLARLFNIREGFTRADDVLPPRFQEALPRHEGLSPELQNRLVTEYYAEHGWDRETGIPTAATIAALGLEADAASVLG